LKLLNEYEYKIPKIWFHEIKGVQDVATAEEIKTTKKPIKFKIKDLIHKKKIT